MSRMNPEHSVSTAPEQVTAITTGLWLALAAFGGAVKYISAVLRSPEVISNRRFIILLAANTFISSFCGLMGGLLVTTFTHEDTWHFLACGLFGYLGTQGLDIILLALRKKIGVNTATSTVLAVPPSVDPANS